MAEVLDQHGVHDHRPGGHRRLRHHQAGVPPAQLLPGPQLHRLLDQTARRLASWLCLLTTCGSAATPASRRNRSTISQLVTSVKYLWVHFLDKTARRLVSWLSLLTTCGSAVTPVSRQNRSAISQLVNYLWVRSYTSFSTKPLGD